MELDKRFKVLPFCCFGAEKCAKYIGQKGYFTNNIDFFKNIDLCIYGTLEEVYGDQADSFQMRDNRKYFRYFIPEYFVKPKEKQYRAFTLNEFLQIYKLGDIVTLRNKYTDNRYVGTVTGYRTDKGGNNGIVNIGSYGYSLSGLFADYERLILENRWVPFGVLEE